jgi:DNA adenine methylase
MRYPGGKGKCYQHIINVFPPHSIYIETHLGGGAVLRHKKPAGTSIGVDRDAAVIQSWERLFPLLASYVEADAVDFLTSQRLGGDELVYCDPPYLPSTRRRARVYRHDYRESDHVRLLETLQKLPCRVVVSGYPSDLYDESLCGWHFKTFPAKAHDGIRQEKIWFNFDPPARLHDARHLGRDFRERQTIKRRLERLQKRVLTLSPQEQRFLSEWLDEHLQEGGIDAGLLLLEG